MQQFRTRSIGTIAARVAITAAIVAISFYALAGIPAVIFFSAKQPVGQLRTASEAEQMPTPVELLASISVDGYWAFPGSYWTIGQRNLAPADREAFWRSLLETAAEVDTADPTENFERLLPMFRMHSGRPMIQEDTTLYRVDYSGACLGCVTRRVAGVECVVGGALLVAADAGPWRAFQLRVNPLHSKGSKPQRSKFFSDEGGRLVAARYNAVGELVGELVELAATDVSETETSIEGLRQIHTADQTRSKVVRVTNDSRDAFVWTTRHESGESRLIVVADSLNSEILGLLHDSGSSN